MTGNHWRLEIFNLPDRALVHRQHWLGQRNRWWPMLRIRSQVSGSSCRGGCANPTGY